jgi:hypothetical protein
VGLAGVAAARLVDRLPASVLLTDRDDHATNGLLAALDQARRGSHATRPAP